MNESQPEVVVDETTKNDVEGHRIYWQQHEDETTKDDVEGHRVYWQQHEDETTAPGQFSGALSPDKKDQP